MRRLIAFVSLFAIFFTFVVPVSIAQEKTPKFTAGTNVVLVPVVVTDKHGAHISGLAAADFELKEDGKPQKIASLEEITSEATPAQRMSGSPTFFTNQVVAQHPKKLVIIALDLVNTTFAGRSEARRGLISFLSKSVNENTLAALVVFHLNGVAMIHNFTSDPEILINAIKRLQTPPSVVEAPALNVSADASTDPRNTAMTTTSASSAGHTVFEGRTIGLPLENLEAAELAAIFEGSATVDTSGSVAQQAASVRSMIAANAAKMDISFQHQAGLVTLECFQQLAQYFASVPGRKSLIWASSGFNFAIGSIAGEATRGTTSEDWERTVHMLSDANIAVYPVDVSGLLTTGAGSSNVLANLPVGGGIAGRSAMLQSVEAGMFNDPTEAKHETMRTVADRTGGEAFYNANDSDKLFQRAASDSSQYYMLSFYTKNVNKEGWHKIELKARRDGTQVRYRTGFFVTKDMRNPELTRQADELMAMTSPLNFATLPLSGEWQQVEAAGNKRKVHFLLNLPPGATTIDTDHENHINVDFIAVAKDASGKDVAQISQRLDRKLPQPGVDQIENHGLSYANTLTVPPGAYKVAIVVRDNLTGKIGSVVSPLKVE